MAPISNTIDKFGRSGGAKTVVISGPPGVGFKLDNDGSYDIQNKRLRHVGEPADDQDGVTRLYVNTHIDECVQSTHKVVQDAIDSITENLKEESQKNFDLRERDLTKSMMTYIDGKLMEHKAVIGMRNRTLVDRIVKLEQLNENQNKTLVDRITKLELVNKSQEEHSLGSKLAIPPYLQPTREIDI